MAEKGQPGVMLYFDLRPCLQRLTNEQKGVLFGAIMDYAEAGVLPEIDDVAVGVAWDFVRPRIDRDAQAYADRAGKARAAINKRWGTKENTDECGRTPEDTDVYERIPTNTDVYERIPTTTTTSTSTSKTTSTSKSTTASTATANANAGIAPLGAAPHNRGSGRETDFVPPTVEEVREYVRSRNSPVDPQGFVDFYESKGWSVGRSPMRNWRAACRSAESWDRWKHGPAGAGGGGPGEQPAAGQKTFSEIIAERTGY